VQRFAQLLDEVGVARDARAFADRYLEHVGEGTHLIDGAETVVEALSERARLALITNGFAQVQRSRFARSPLTRFFEPIVISDEVGVAKPDPAIFDEAFRRMQNPSTSDVLMIGDSLSADIRGGIGYGLDTCWFNPANRPRPTDLPITHEIHCLNELLPLV
jgi:YjjG family noncanonical pyrimidine nucleotidase